MAVIQMRLNAKGEKRYRVLVRLKGHPAESETFDRLTDARRWAQDKESGLRDGRHRGVGESKRHTLAGAVDRYVRDVLPRKRPKTVSAQTCHFAWWRENYGHLALCDVTPQVIAEARDRLLTEPCYKKTLRTDATCRRYLAALSHLFSKARREWGWVTFNPVVDVEKPRESEGRTRFLSDQERQGLLSACETSGNADLCDVVCLALCTGGRRGEIMGMTWGEVHLDLGKVIIGGARSKNKEQRVLVLSGPALEVMERRSKHRRIDTTLVFPGHFRAGAPTRPAALTNAFLRAVKVAKLNDFKFHDCRHDFASRLAKNGASLFQIANALGHKTLAMVKRYAHLCESDVSDIVTRMVMRPTAANTQKGTGV